MIWDNSLKEYRPCEKAVKRLLEANGEKKQNACAEIGDGHWLLAILVYSVAQFCDLNILKAEKSLGSHNKKQVASSNFN